MSDSNQDSIKAKAYGRTFMQTIGLPCDKPSLHADISTGISTTVFQAFARAIGKPPKALASIAGISESTLKRRNKTGTLSLDEGDRLVRLATTYAQAIELFEGNAEAAWHWLNKPAIALGGEKPVEVLRTTVGVGLVSDVMGRIEHGVYM